jgi:hypothetical protein
VKRPWCGCRTREPWDGIHFVERDFGLDGYEEVLVCYRGDSGWEQAVKNFGGFYWLQRWNAIWRREEEEREDV